METSNDHLLANLEFDENLADVEFYETIPTLRDIASYTIAIECWRQFLKNENQHEYDKFQILYTDFGSLKKIHETKAKEILNQSPMPRLIRDQIENCLRSVRKEMNRALHNKIDAFVRDWAIELSDLAYFHWLPNGEIDYLRTASNLLSNPRMKPADKFKIACSYCLEDEIKKFPVDSLPADFIKDVRFYNDPLIFYWFCYLNNDLGKLPKEYGRSVESFLIGQLRMTNWSAIQFFWDRLTIDEQTSKLEAMRYVVDHKFSRSFFFKITPSQKSFLISEIPIEIMCVFLKQPGQGQLALSIWIHIRNFVDYRQFKQLMDGLRWEDFSNIYQKIAFMADVWNHCPDYLKKLALQPDFADVVMDIYWNNFQNHPYCDDIEFLIAYLSYADVKFRRNFILSRFEKFSLIIDPSVMDQLLELCLTNASDVAKFKKDVSKSKHVLCQFDKIFIRSKINFEKIRRFFDYYCLDLNTRREFCKNMAKYFTESYPSATIWIKAIEFVDENLLLTLPDHSSRYKKEIVMSLGYRCCERLSNYDDMSKVIGIAAQLLDADELENFKDMAVDGIEIFYNWHHFEEDFINEFLMGCSNNDSLKAKEFKKTINIDVAFEHEWNWLRGIPVLQSNVDQETVHRLFKTLDKILHWYLDDFEYVKCFKLKKVFMYRDENDKGDSLFAVYGKEISDVFIRNTLPWFFEGDRSSIEVFKKVYWNEDIGKMI